MENLDNKKKNNKKVIELALSFLHFGSSSIVGCKRSFHKRYICTYVTFFDQFPRMEGDSISIWERITARD
jgi:hypothetical protein